MAKLELLAPAGNLNKLKTALHFGADAVYIGGKNFSLRSYATNFSNDELIEAVNFAHNLGKKVYVTVNIFAKNSDLQNAKEYFSFLNNISADAVIVTDPGLIAICKTVAPHLQIHLSTQANTLNSAAVQFWGDNGVSRVVLARELSLSEISEINKACPNVELETFIHGAMCVSYSGRCLLSNYFTDRDSNRGECVQVCRWKYKLTEIDRHKNSNLEIEEDEHGTYFMNSKDLCLIEYIKELSEAGVCSFKIEGRMKSEFYIAVVVSAYRKAIDSYLKHGVIEQPEILKSFLNKIANRDYTTAYFLADNDKTINYTDDKTEGTAEFTANVLEYENGFAIVEMRNRFQVGDELKILSPSESCNKTFVVSHIEDMNGKAVTDAKLVQQKLLVKCPFSLCSGDILYKDFLSKSE